MNVKVGDKVRFLNDIGGGTVVKIIDRQSVMVLNDDDFEVPTPVSELVVIESAADSRLRGSSAENKSEKPKPQSVTTDADEQDEPESAPISLTDIFYPPVAIDKGNGDYLREYLAFVPKANQQGFDIYLINDSNYNVLYSIIATDADEQSGSEAVGVLEANTKVQFSTLAMSNVNLIPAYTFHLTFYRKGSFKIKEPLSRTIELNPVKFYKEASFVKNEFFSKNAMMIALIDEHAAADSVENMTEKDFKKVMAEKLKGEKVEHKEFKSGKAIQSQIVEVDLHIHELLDDFRGLSNSEMLEIQMRKFREELDNAMRKGVKKIVFIHGVGAGVLKLEIRKELDRMKKKLDYQDASFKEYGYGATLVRIF